MQACAIDPPDRVGQRIQVGVEPALEADRVGFEVAAEGRVVLAETVMVIASLGTDVLSREPQILDNIADRDLRLAERLIAGRP